MIYNVSYLQFPLWWHLLFLYFRFHVMYMAMIVYDFPSLCILILLSLVLTDWVVNILTEPQLSTILFCQFVLFGSFWTYIINYMDLNLLDYLAFPSIFNLNTPHHYCRDSLSLYEAQKLTNFSPLLLHKVLTFSIYYLCHPIFLIENP